MSDAPNAPTTPSIPVERSGQALIARPQMKMIDDQSLKALGQTIDEMSRADSGVSVVVVDLSRVQLVPSLALGLLVQLSNKCKARQQKLKLAAATPQVRQVFSITRLDRVLEFADTVEAAIA